jgi:hypothetical protein
MDGSDKATREIEENYYGSVKELSIDNPLMKEAIELDHAIKKLKSLQKGFRNEVANAARQLQLLPSETDRLKEEVDKIRKDMSLRAPESTGDQFVMMLAGQEYAERREAGLELLRTAKLLNEKSRSTGREVQKEVGNYAGLPVAIHANGLWDNRFAEIYAQGKCYCYGADIRVDSDPVGLIRSLHHSVYKGMETKLASAERVLASREATRPGLEKMTLSRFAKVAELEAKETRYKEVVEAIQASNGKHSDREEATQLDWEALDQWSEEKLREEVSGYLERVSTTVIERGREEATSPSGQLAQRIKELYAVQLPMTLMAFIEDGVCRGKLSAEGVLQIIGKVMDDFDSRGPTWNEGNGDGLAGSFRRNGGGLCAGDMVIRKESSSDGATYKAYLIIAEGKEKFLGNDDSLPAVRARARQFYVFSDMAARLRKGVEVDCARTAGRFVSDRHRTREAGVENGL